MQFTDNGDIVYSLRGYDYNLAEILTDWQAPRRNIDITNHLRYFDPELILWQQKKTNAELHGIEFTLDFDDIKLHQHCPVSGVSFEPPAWNTLYAPSIDRINSKRGYVAGNVVVIIHDWNKFKFNLNWQQLRGLIDNLPKQLKHISKVFNAFEKQFNYFDITDVETYCEQLADDATMLNDRLIRLLIVCEHELWLNGMDVKRCKTILEYEPDLVR